MKACTILILTSPSNGAHSSQIRLMQTSHDSITKDKEDDRNRHIPYVHALGVKLPDGIVNLIILHMLCSSDCQDYEL
jgi:hypothetical protein